MKLIVGLGNPGEEYENTRHNTGRILVGMLEKKFEEKNPNSKIKFIKPDTFMNNSGKAVAPLVKSKKSEEFLRIRIGISPATQKGGVRNPKGETRPNDRSRPVGREAVLSFLLGEFKKPELETIKKLAKKVAEAV